MVSCKSAYPKYGQDTVKFTTNSGTSHSFSFEYKNKLLTEVPKFKFLSLYTDNQLNGKSHTEEIIPKLSAVCYAIRKLLFFRY